MLRCIAGVVPLGAVLGLLCGIAAAATPLDEGLRLLEQGEGLRALAALKPLAHDGSAEAQYRLGTIYEQGLGILPDDYWAWYWYQAAAAQGHTPAVEALQALSARHNGVPPGTIPDAAGGGSSTPPSGGADPFIHVPQTAAAAPPADSPGGVPAVELPATDVPVANGESSAPAAPAAPDGGGQLLAPGPGELAALERARAAGVQVDFDPSLPLPASRGDDVTGQPTGDGPGEGEAREAAGPPLPTVVADAPAALPQPSAPAVAGAAEPQAQATMALARLPDASALSGLPQAELTALASDGNVEAQRELAVRLHSGRVPDLPAAIAWYRKAAEAGDAEAQFQLGNLYLMGDGLPVDDAWAITWFRRAAAQGHAKAEAHLENLMRMSGGAP